MTIRVRLKNPSSRRFYLAQWDDPLTGLVKTRSTECTIKRDAERFAARLEDELNSGTYRPPSETAWDELERRYLDEVSAGKRPKTRGKTKSMFNAVRDLLNPKSAQSMADPNAVSKFGSKLRDGRTFVSKNGKKRFVKLEPASIKGHLSELRKVLRWAKRMNIIRQTPHIEFPEVDPSAKGRPITAEELDRMVAKIPNEPRIPLEFAADWEFGIQGLFLSGLRLEEATEFHWTDDRRLCVDFTGRRPMMKIQAAAEKGKTFRFLPITPDFAEHLESVPPGDRIGFVFKFLTRPQGGRWQRVVIHAHRPTVNHVGRIISSLGELAGVKVSETKFASAHDLRRSFGQRWSKLVMPPVLQELMRHDDIKTTMQYYVGKLAEDAADAVWEAAARQSGNTSGNTKFQSEPQTAKIP